MTKTRKAFSQNKDPNTRVVDDALRDVMLGVYYRHEFARRNPEVVEASNDVFKEFSEAQKVRSKHSTFIIPGKSLKSITALLMEEILKDPDSSKKKGVMVKFLQDYKVLPVPPPEHQFLPLPLILESKRQLIKMKGVQADSVALSHCWSSIQAFETFAVCIGLREPIFMPFTNLPKTRELV